MGKHAPDGHAGVGLPRRIRGRRAKSPRSAILLSKQPGKYSTSC
jgi:hypothetical protein